MKLAIVIHSDDPETVWNAFRLAVFACKQGDQVRVFLLARGVTAEKIGTAQFPVAATMEEFLGAGGDILACGTCLTIREQGSSDLCPASTMSDLHALIRESDKVVSF